MQGSRPTCHLRLGLARGELLSYRRVSTSWFCLLFLEPLHACQLSPLGSASVGPHSVSPTVLVTSLCGLKCHRSVAFLGFSCVHGWPLFGLCPWSGYFHLFSLWPFPSSPSLSLPRRNMPQLCSPLTKKSATACLSWGTVSPAEGL